MHLILSHEINDLLEDMSRPSNDDDDSEDEEASNN